MKRAQKIVLKSKENIRTDDNVGPLREIDADCTFAFQYLRSGSITAEELDIYWRQCSPMRFKQIMASKSTLEALKLWPEYTKPNGGRLIDIDFSLKFPLAKDIKITWTSLEIKLFAFLKTKLPNSTLLKKFDDEDTSSNQESKQFAIFWTLHQVFPPPQRVTSDENGSKIRKKFSILDSQESFAFIGSTKEEIAAKLNLAKLQNRCIQPKLLIVGELTNIKSIVLYFDGIEYPFLTILDAVDILFKIFYVFNLQYPEESDTFYNFIQDFFYDMPKKKKYAKVSVIKNEILTFDL
ncbi:uncharacterized protein LOC142240498 [Haematobia irritans]|uniref:uncharacterized protein LOC142240498 n=1 Tax=Haematobia irritans TaxID=7368 RepID=UPI003F5017D8